MVQLFIRSYMAREQYGVTTLLPTPPARNLRSVTKTLMAVYTASDIAVAPDNPQVVALPRHQHTRLPEREQGVAIYDNGVKRPQTQPGHNSGSDFLTYGATSSTLYGGGFSGLSTMTVNADGVTVTSTVPFTAGRDIVFANNLIYGAGGQVMNPSNGALVGTFSGLPDSRHRAVAVDTANGRIFFLTGDSGQIQIRAFDINTFIPLGFINIQGVGRNAREFSAMGHERVGIQNYSSATGSDSNSSGELLGFDTFANSDTITYAIAVAATYSNIHAQDRSACKQSCL